MPRHRSNAARIIRALLAAGATSAPVPAITSLNLDVRHFPLHRIVPGGSAASTTRYIPGVQPTQRMNLTIEYCTV